MINRKSFLILAITAGLAMGQGPRGPQGPGGPQAPGTPAGTGIDMTKQVLVEGTVTAVNIAYGAQYPSVQVEQKLVKVAPVWFLLENDMELKVGNVVSITAAPGLGTNSAYLYAIKIVNKTEQVELALRDADGYPLWMARGNQRGQPQNMPLGAGTCIDPASIQNVSGVVDSIAMGAGIQMPRLILKTGDKLLTIKLGPERILLSKDFEVEAGEQVSMKIAYASCSGEFVALQITNSQGQTVVLRNDDGSIAWN